MKTKLKTTLALLAAFCGLQLFTATPAFADDPTPLAVWDGDFVGADTQAGAVRGDFTIRTTDGGLVAYNGSYVTVGDSANRGVLVDWNTSVATSAAGFQNKAFTMIVRYANLEDATYIQSLSTVWSGTTGAETTKAYQDKYGFLADKKGVTPAHKVYGFSGGATLSAGSVGVPCATSTDIYSMAVTYDALSAGYAAYFRTGSATTFTSIYANSSYKASSENIYGATIGGTRMTSSWAAARRMRVHKVAIFNSVLTAEQIAAYQFDSEKAAVTYSATVSGEQSWTGLSWSQTWPSGGAANANATLDVSGASTLTVDAVERVKTLTVTSDSGELLTIANCNNLKADAVDLSAANGRVAIAGIDPINDLAKNAVAGVPYSYWLFNGATVTGASNIQLPTLPTGYSVAIENASGYGCRFVVTAPDTAKFGAVSVNVRGGTSETLASASSFGLYPMLGSDWGYQSDATAVTKDDITFTPYISSGTFGTENNNSKISSNTDPRYIFRGFCMDINDSTTIGYTLTGLNAKYPKYRVIVYMATDSANIYFCPVKINDVSYCGPSTGTTGGYTVKRSAAEKWGHTGAANDSNNMGEGVNAVISDVLTADTVNIRTIRKYHKTTGTRATIAAIQVVKVGDYVGVKEFNASINEAGTTNLTQLAWDQTFSPKATDTATITIGSGVTGEVVLNLDVADMSIGTFKVISSGSATLKLTGNNPTAITKWDFAEVTGKITFGFEPEFAKITKGTYPCIGLDYNVTGTIQNGFEYLGANNVLTLATINSGTVVIGGGGTFSGDLDVYGNASVTIGGTYTSPNNDVKLATSKGTLTIAEGADISVTSICLVNSGDTSNSGIFNVNGKLTVTSTCDSTVYGKHDKHQGILFAHYYGSSAVTVGPNGQLIGENTWIQLTYSSTSSLTVNGGTVKVLGLNIGSKPATPVTVTNGGTLELKDGTSTTTGVYTFNGGKLKAWGDYTFTGTSVTLTGDNTIDPAGHAIVLSTATSGEGNATINDSVGTGSVDFGTARPRLKAITAGTVKLTATSAEMGTGTITLPYAGSVVPSTSSIVITKTDGNTAEWADTDPITLADNVLTLKFKVNAPITSSTTLSEAQVGKTGVLVVDGSGSTAESPLVFTFDVAVADGITQIRVLGNVQLGVSGSITRVPMAKLSIDADCAPVFTASPDSNMTIPSGATYTIVGGADASSYMDYVPNFTINGTLQTKGYIDTKQVNSTIPSGGHLKVLDGNLKYYGGGKGVSGTITVMAGATFTNGRSDSFNYDGSPVLNVYGTVLAGTTRISLGANCVVNLYTGGRIEGTGNNSCVLDYIDNINPTLYVKKSASASVAVIDAPIKIRTSGKNLTFDIAQGAHLECHKPIIGSGGIIKKTSTNSTMAFYAANTYTGATALNNGYLTYMPGSSTTTSGITAASGTALELGGTSFSSTLAAGTSDQVALTCPVTNNGRIDVFGSSKISGAYSGDGYVDVKNGGLLQTVGDMSFTNANNDYVRAGGTLEVVSGTLTYTANGSHILGTLTIDAGATFTPTVGDSLAYGSSPTVNVKGTLAMGDKRWTIGSNCKLNLYPGCSVTGTGDNSGAIDFYQANTNFKVVDDGTTDAITLSGTLRFRESGDTTLDVGAPVTVNLSSAILGGKTLTLTGVTGSTVALSSASFDNVTIAAGAGVTLAPTVAVPRLTLNAGAIIKPAAGGLTVSTTFTKNGAYHIDGSLALTDTTVGTYSTLITAPSAPSIDGVTATGANGKEWDLRVNDKVIEATYVERTEIHWNATNNRWENDAGEEVTPSATTIIKFNDGDNITFGESTTVHSAYVVEGATATITNQNNLVCATLNVPAGTTLVLGSNADIGATMVEGAGTIKYDAGQISYSNNVLTDSKLAGFTGVLQVTSGRMQRDAALTGGYTVQIVDGGQLYVKGGTWSGTIDASGNGWAGEQNVYAKSPLRLEGGTIGGSFTAANTTGSGYYSVFVSGNSTVKNPAGWDVTGDVFVINGTLTLGADDGTSGATYKFGDTIQVESGKTLKMNLHNSGDTVAEPSNRITLDTEVKLNGGTISSDDGSFGYARVNVLANSTISPEFNKGQVINYLTGTAGTTLTFSGNGHAYNLPTLTIKDGDYAGKVLVSGTNGYVDSTANLFLYGFAMQNGTVELGENAKLMVQTDATIGTLTGNARPVSGSGTTLTLKGGSVSGVISGALNLLIAGNVTLSGENTYTGTTTIDAAGTLTIGNVSAMGTGKVMVSGTLNLGAYRPANVIDNTSTGVISLALVDATEKAAYDAGTLAIDLSTDAAAAGAFGGQIALFDVDGTTPLRGAASFVDDGGTIKLRIAKSTHIPVSPYTTTNPASGNWTAAMWTDSTTPDPLTVQFGDWVDGVGANIKVEGEQSSSLTLNRPLTLSTLNITNAGTLAIADAGDFTLTATTIDDSASTGTTTLDFAPGAAVITAGVNTVVTKAGTGSGAIHVASGKKATVPAYYYDHRGVSPGGYLKIMGDLGEKSLNKNSGLASNGATIDIGGTATIVDSAFESNAADTKLVISGNVVTKDDNNEIKIAQDANVIFEVAEGGTFTVQSRVMPNQNTTATATINITGGTIQGAQGKGFWYVGGYYGKGASTINISAGSFTVPWEPYGNGACINTHVATVNVSGTGVFAPTVIGYGDGNYKANPDWTTVVANSKHSVNLSANGTFKMPAGVPNWLPVNVTSGVGVLGVQDGVTTADNRGLLTVASGATARILAGQGKTILAKGGIASSGTIALVSGTLKIDSDTFTLGTVNFNGGTLDINGKTVSGVTLQGTGTIYNTAATAAKVNGVIIPAGGSKQVENGVIVLPEATGAIHATVAESTTETWSDVAWFNSSEEQVRIGDVANVESATLTLAGTMTINNWTSISALRTKLTITGAGRVEYNFIGSDIADANPTWIWAAGESGWTGTYKLSGFNGSKTNWDPTVYYNSTYSKFEFAGTMTGTDSNKSYFAQKLMTLGELVLTGSITFNDGYSKLSDNTTYVYYSFTKLSGAGSLSATPNASPTFCFKDVSAFTGSLSITATNQYGYRILIGNSNMAIGSTPAWGAITIDVGAQLNSATLSAKQGIRILENAEVTLVADATPVFNSAVTLDGHLTAVAIANLGGTGAITVNSAGTIEFTKSCGKGDESADYSRVTGTGKFKLSGSGYFLLPKTSETRPAKELQFVNEKTGGVIVTEASSTAGTAPVTEIGTLSGSKNFRMDWAPAYDNNRSLKILQAHNSTWTGKFGNNQNRLKEFIVAGATGATEKTLTLSATFDNANPTLNVESTGSVRLTGTWAGSATISGEIMGSGAIQGTATFNSGATLVVEAEGSVLTVNTIASLDGVTVKLPAGVTKEQVTNYTVIKLASATQTALNLGEVTIYSGTEQLGEFGIVIPAGSTDAKPVAGAEYVATIPSDATSPVDFKTLSWSPALPAGETLPTAARWTITTEAADVTLNIAQDLAANMLKIVGALGKNLTLATTASVSASNYDFSEASGKVTVGFGTGAATIALAGETELKVMPTATSGFEVASGKKLVLGWDSSDAYAQVISGAGAVDITGNVTLGADNSAATGTLTVQSGGTLKMGSINCLPQARATVEQDGTFDFNGKMDNGGAIAITLNGGTLTNTGSSLGTGNTAMASITLGADSTIDLASGHNWGMIAGSHGATSIDLNGYTLTKMGDGTFYLISTTISDAGSLVIDGGTVNIANKGSLNVSCETATVVVNNGATLSVDSGKSPTIAKLTVNSGTISNSGTITGLAEIKGNVDLGSTGTGTITIANSVTVGTEGGEDVITMGSLDLTSKSFTVNGGTLNLAQDGTARSVGGLTIANPATLVISTNETAAAVAVTGSVDLENATIVLSGLLPAAGGTAKILSATDGITNYSKSLAEIRGEWTIAVTENTLTATKAKANYVKPGAGGDVSDVGNDTDSLDISRDLAKKATKDMEKKVTDGSTTEQVVEALNQVGANTYKVWESAVLGLDPASAASQLVITPIQTSNAKKVTLQVPTVNVDTTTGADVTFCFWSKTADGDWTEVQGGVVESGEQKELALPEDGVMYYQLRTTIKAGQLTPIPTVIPSANIVAAGAPVMTTPGTQYAASMGTKTLDAVSSSLTVDLAGAGVYEGQEYHLEVTEPANADENHFAIVAKATAQKTVTFAFGKNVLAGTTCKLTLLGASGAPNGNIVVKTDGFEGVTYDNVMVTAMLADRPMNDELGGVQDHNGYRIPSLATDGAGEVIACYDIRYYGNGQSSSDLGCATGAGIDIGESYSADAGVSFDAPRRAIDVVNHYYAPGETMNTITKETDIGDTSVVWDPNRNVYWLMGITGGGLLASDGTNKNDVVLYTRAKGQTAPWTEWHNPALPDEADPLKYRSIQHSVMSQVVGSGESSGKGFFEGPGHGMVTKIGKEGVMPVGTVVFPVQYFIGTAQSGAIYLKPGTPTVENNWKATGRTTADGSQENCIMELDDGSWYMMCKKDSSYKAWRTTDYQNWVDINDGIYNVRHTQGSCLRIGSKNGVGQYVCCHVTDPNNRAKLAVFFGVDTTAGETGTIPSTTNKGIEWDKEHPLMIDSTDSGGMMYNSMCMLDDHTLGILYEYKWHIYFTRIDVSDKVDTPSK